MKVILLLLVFCLLSMPLAAQDGSGNDAGNSGSEEIEYEPYTKEEFPEWLLLVRRAEVVMVGSFPITMLFTTLAYDGFTSFRQVVTNGSTESAQYTDAELRGLLITGVSLSAVVTIIDFFLGRRNGAR